MERNNILKCNLCGNIIEVIEAHSDNLVCCGQDMNILQENIIEASTEKHIPAVEKTNGGILVKIGSIAHPMEEKHYIQWVEVISKNKSYKKFFSPNNKPEAFFPIEDDKLIVRAYCNLHGLWKK